MTDDGVGLSEGWEAQTLGDVAIWSSGGTPKAGTKSYYGGAIPWAVIGDLTDGIVSSTAASITELGLANSSAKIMPPNTLLVAMYGASIGKLGIAAMPTATNQAIACAQPLPGHDLRYLFHWLRSQRRNLVHAGQGGAQPNISQTVLKAWPVPVPPLAEQQRIASRLDEIDNHRGDIAGRLSLTRHIVKRLRTAILGAACDGRLTASWREEHGSSFDAPASRPRNVASDERNLPAGGDPTLYHDLPRSWRAVSLDLLIDRIEAGRSVRADGRPALPSEWGVIKVSAMSWGTFLDNENKAITNPALIDPRYEIRRGDLLVSRANTVDLVGASVHVQTTRPKLLLSDKSLRLIPHDGVDKAWLNLALRSPISRAQFAERATGTSDSMRNLSQPKILATTIALPPPEEQGEIVRRTTAALDAADRLERSISAASEALAHAMRGALGMAFRGELVPTEAELLSVAA